MIFFFGQKAFRAVGHQFSAWMVGQVRTARGKACCPRNPGAMYLGRKVFSLKAAVSSYETQES